ncbi:hypothetical protein [Aneurinibacillus aneurinilyticus]|uniref:hypothetical protein n=2 Tax=Aneurinibacillus aneurinilyticus TaxID=1391 RepID=UPI0035262856
MIIAVASNGQGASIFSYDLAQQCAQNRRTLLIDFETLHPDITAFLDEEQSSDFGIDAVFKRHEEITPRIVDICTFTTTQGFLFLPGTRQPHRLDVPHYKIRDLLQAADKFADVVIVDCPDRFDVATGLHTFAQAHRILRIRHHAQTWKAKLREEQFYGELLDRFGLNDKIEEVWIGKTDRDRADWTLPEVAEIDFETIPKEYSAAVRRIAADILGVEEEQGEGWLARWRSRLTGKVPRIGQ